MTDCLCKVLLLCHSVLLFLFGNSLVAYMVETTLVHETKNVARMFVKHEYRLNNKERRRQL